MDVFTPEKRSRIMSGIRSANTRPELVLRKFLHARGFRYRLGAKAGACRPDVVLPRHRVAVFLHGCFWHRHEGCALATRPSSNTEYWDAKFAANTARDARTVDALLAAGWRVAVIWECWSKRKLDLEWLPAWIRESDERLVIWPADVRDAPRRRRNREE